MLGCYREKATTLGKMVKHIKGIIINQLDMAMGYKPLKMEEITRVSGKEIKKMVKEFLNGQVDKCIQENSN